MTFGEPTIDVDKLRAYKQGVVDKLTAGVGSVAKLRKVKFIQGRATLTGPKSLKVAGAAGETELQFEHLILATGSHPTKIPSLSLDSPRMMDSTSGLELPDVPKSLLVIGGGYIGLELGTVYATLGSKVSVVEMTPGLLPGADRDLVGVLEKRLKKLFAAIMLNTKVVKVAEEGKGIRVTFEGDVAEKEQVFDRVLVAVGRRPNSKIPGLETTAVKVDAEGVHRDRPAAPHRGADDLRHWRRGRRADARAQGVARGARRRRSDCRAQGGVRAAGDSGRRLHRSRRSRGAA